MNWFESTEDKRSIIIGGIVLVCLAAIFVTIRLENIAADSYWHLKTGLDWLNHGSSFWYDHYSFTFDGKEISSPPYMFEVMLAWLVNIFGLDSGFELYKFLSFISTFALVTYFLAKLKAPVFIYCLVLPLLVALLQLRAIVRPEIISYSFSVLAIMLYYRANNKVTTANLLPIAVLMLVWSNFHTSSIFGYVIFFGFFVDSGLEQLRNKAAVTIWLKWLFWGVAVVAAGFINPGFNHPLIAALAFDETWKTLILEYRSSLKYLTDPAIYALLLVSITTLILLVRKRQFGLLIVCLVLGYNAMTISRMVAPGGIVILCIFAWKACETDFISFFRNCGIKRQKAFGAVVFMIIITGLFAVVSKSRSYMEQNAIATPFPVDVANYMAENNISGRIFNEYKAGGYLIYRLSPDSKVYIDGRTEILYPVEHFYQYLKASMSSNELHSETERYAINLAVMTNTHQNFALVENARDMSLDFVGTKYSLFKTGQANFPLLGALLASPACMNNSMTADLIAEQKTARDFLPANSFLSPSLIAYITNYSRATDKKAFIQSQEVDSQWSSTKLRMTAYWALSSNLDDMAYELFLSLPDAGFADFLAAALAKIQLGEWDNAERILDSATRTSASDNPKVILLLHALLVQIQTHGSLELFDASYINSLMVDAEKSHVESLNKPPIASDFCFSEQ